jgi:hypothetical protein
LNIIFLKDRQNNKSCMLSFKCRDVGLIAVMKLSIQMMRQLSPKLEIMVRMIIKLSPNDFTPELLEKIKDSI